MSLPAGLRREHRTKAGVWGIVRVLEGQLNLSFVDPPEERLVTPDACALLLPDQAHFVTVGVPMRMQVEFYDELPLLENERHTREDASVMRVGV